MQQTKAIFIDIFTDSFVFDKNGAELRDLVKCWCVACVMHCYSLLELCLEKKVVVDSIFDSVNDQRFSSDAHSVADFFPLLFSEQHLVVFLLCDKRCVYKKSRFNASKLMWIGIPVLLQFCIHRRKKRGRTIDMKRKNE